MMDRFYVTAVDGRRAYFLAGPYSTKEEAEGAVDNVRDIACDHEQNSNAGRAHFMAYGVTRENSDRSRITPLGQVQRQTQGAAA
ncbi:MULTISPECIES: hypothetical protein [unclassified Mameliella]|uniref:hypothetical protein n=1 Tax=Mameliella sp. LZ-28 TaxID=2484146 RepID=UPI00143F456D|nr:hypothetical protein [Mameliella sp. LZ-28]MCR9276233.1 hypothetical protein [Paracoccaceae bacterium]